MAKLLIGKVTSDKPNKSIVVTVVAHKTHPVYKKRYISSKKFMAHDEHNKARIGDKVSIKETKPLSAKKRFVLDTILETPAIREGIVGDVDINKVTATKKSSTTAKKDTV